VRIRADADGSYYKDSIYVASAEVAFETLFAASTLSSSSTPAVIVDSTTTPSTVTGFSVSVDFTSIVKADTGITYSVERADVDDAGNVGKSFAAVTLSKWSSSGYVSAGASDLTPDPLGHLPTSVEDRTLPVRKAAYRYRVKATKGDVTQTREYSSNSVVNTNTLIGALASSVSIGGKTVTNVTAGNDNYSYGVAPSVRKGILQADDKLLIYYVKGSNSGLYNTGPYASVLTFSKAQLEAATPQPLTISKTGSDAYAFVQAWLVFADGTERNITSVYGGGVNGGVNYDSLGNSYVRLDY
jgi:hypothetical protein